MRRDEQDGVIAVEAPLRGVAVVDVVIDDGDAIEATGTRVRRGDGDVVEETESHRTVPLGMMTRWSDERQGARITTLFEHMLDSGHSCASGQPCHLEGLGRRIRV